MEESSIRIAMSIATAATTETSPWFIDLLILAFLILINAFFAATELAIISLNDNKIRRKAEEGDKIAAKIYHLIVEPSRFLATIQVGVTLAGFLSSAFAAEKFADRLYKLIGVELPIIHTVSVVIVTILLAYFSLVLGELVPKRLAQHNPEKLANAVVGTITVLGVFMHPFVKLLTLSTNFVLRSLKVDPSQVDRSVTEEEIRMMVDVGRELGNIHEEEKEMIENIFEFNDMAVKEIMTHRTDVVALDVDSTFEEVIEKALQDQYTRIPVYQDSIDNIIGILHVKDLLKVALESPRLGFTLQNLIRPPYLVPESKNSDAVFRQMQKDHVQMAVVIDEYGGTAGIITIEDLIEEIVGSLQDEYDEEESAIIQIDKFTFEVDGMTPLDDVSDAFSIEFPDDDIDTLAGLVIRLLGKIPDEHEKLVVHFGKLQFTVLAMDDKRITKVQIRVESDEATKDKTNES